MDKVCTTTPHIISYFIILWLTSRYDFIWFHSSLMWNPPVTTCWNPRSNWKKKRKFLSLSVSNLWKSTVLVRIPILLYLYYYLFHSIIFLVSGCDGLRKKAAELWQSIVTLETEKYDLEERSKRQDYDVSSNDSFILFLNYHDSQLILLIIILRQGDFW